MKIKNLFTIALLAIFSSCSNDSTSDIAPTPTPPNNSTTIKYTTDVSVIISNNCLGCHSSPPVNGAPMQLTTYADVKNAILTRGLIDRISRPQGAAGMMPNGGTRLPQETIDKIIKWQTDGFIN